MPQARAVPVMLSAGERRTLRKRARGAKTAHRDWLRAQIVLAAARGRANAKIAADLHSGKGRAVVSEAICTLTSPVSSRSALWQQTVSLDGACMQRFPLVQSSL